MIVINRGINENRLGEERKISFQVEYKEIPDIDVNKQLLFYGKGGGPLFTVSLLEDIFQI